MRFICPECQKQFNSLLVSPLEALTDAGLAVSKHIQKAHATGPLMQETQQGLAKLILMINEFLPFTKLSISSNGPAWEGHEQFAIEYKKRLAFDIVRELAVEELLGFTLPELVTPRLDEYRGKLATEKERDSLKAPKPAPGPLDIPPESTQ